MNKPYTGIANISFDEAGAGRALERAEKLLYAFPGGVQRVAERSLKRAFSKSRTAASREVGRQYLLKASDFDRYNKTNGRIIRAGNEISLEINYSGQHIPIIRFDARTSSSGAVRAHVKRDTSAKDFEHAFRMGLSSGHMGVFERRGRTRLPIDEIKGPSAPQMMNANPTLAPKIGEQLSKAFEERIEHEILAIMNGWAK